MTDRRTEFERAFDGPLFVFEAALTEEGFLLKYAEEREQSQYVSIDRMIWIAPQTEERQIVFAEIQDKLRWLVDDGLRELRAPELYAPKETPVRGNEE